MAVGSSGRIVIEVNPELKQELHEQLRLNGTNLKEWFLVQASEYLQGNQVQIPMEFRDESIVKQAKEPRDSGDTGREDY